jgi:O-antigen/teichoic acid export membrane protein
VDLRSRVITGMLWTGGARLISQVWTWVITIVVIRLLSPDDYGLLAMATIFVAFLSLIAEAGLGAALIQADRLDDTVLRRVFGAIIAINCGLFALQYAIAPMIARFFYEERLVLIIRVLSLQYLLMIFTAIPNAVLSRKLDFKRQSIINLVGSICGSVTSLALAYHGYGVWSLVISSLLVCVWQAVALNVISPFLQRPEFAVAGMRSLLQAGTQVTATRVLWFVYSQADIFLAGRLLGAELLGFYSVALHLASLPVQRLSALLNQIAYPAFAEVRRDGHAVQFYMLKVLRVLSLISFPMLWGISAVAPEIVAVLLGPRWHLAVLPLQLLPLMMPVNLIGLFLNTAFQGIGRTKEVLMNSLVATAVLPVAFYVGAQWSLPGLAIGWLGGYTLIAVLNLKRMLPTVGLRMRDVGYAVARPVFAAAMMYAVVGALRAFAPLTTGTALTGLLLIAAGAVTYCGATVLTNRTGVRELFALARIQRA